MKIAVFRIIFLLSFIFILNCDVFVKKNEGEFDKNQNDYYYYISYSGNSDNFTGAPSKFINSIDRRYLYTYLDSGITDICVFNVDNNNGHIFSRRLIASGRHLAISPDNKFLYTTNGGIIYVYKRNDNGGVISIGNIATGFDSVTYLIVSPNNSFVYVLGSIGAAYSIYCYKKDLEDGKLSLSSSLGVSGSIKFLLSPDFKHLYLLVNLSSIVEWYEINDNGSLKYKSFISTISSTSELCISQDGKYLYVVQNLTNIQLYKRNNSNGDLSFINSVSATNTINSIIVSPDKKYLYLATGSAASSSIEWFNRNIDSGNISNHNILNNSSILNTPTSINFSSQGDFIFVLNQGNFNFAIFKINKD